jgi:hypothetical protein
MLEMKAPFSVRSRDGPAGRSQERGDSNVKVALAAILVVSLAACSGRQADDRRPSAVASPSAPGSALPSVSPSLLVPPSAVPTTAPSTPIASSPPAVVLDVDTLAMVVTDDLRVRSKPRVAADSALRTPLLQKGRQVFVVDGPVQASGYSWYEVAPIQAPGEFVELPFGWVAAAGTDGEPWLAAGGSRCPEKPADVAAFLAVPALAGLACFGRHDLAISGRLARPEATCGVDIGWTIEPEWLASTCPHPKFYLVDDDTTGASFGLVLNPGIDVADLDPGTEPPDWLDVLVMGHFDVRAAATCHGVVTELGTVIELSPAEIVLSCRATFVVTRIETSGSLP